MCSWTGEMAQWIKTLAAKPDNYNSIPGPHMVERENKLISCLLTSTGQNTHTHMQTYIHALVCTHTHVIMHTHTQRERDKYKKKLEQGLCPAPFLSVKLRSLWLLALGMSLPSTSANLFLALISGPLSAPQLPSVPGYS